MTEDESPRERTCTTRSTNQRAIPIRPEWPDPTTATGSTDPDADPKSSSLVMSPCDRRNEHECAESRDRPRVDPRKRTHHESDSVAERRPRAAVV